MAIKENKFTGLKWYLKVFFLKLNAKQIIS
jgi:hypothetical protein